MSEPDSVIEIKFYDEMPKGALLKIAEDISCVLEIHDAAYKILIDGKVVIRNIKTKE
jgi:hypothetical protein